MADLNLQAAVDMTITRMLDGAGLHGIPDYRIIEIEIADDRSSGRLVCPRHGYLIAELDANLTVTVEHGCVECDILSCNDCSTFHQHLCNKHHGQVSA